MKIEEQVSYKSKSESKARPFIEEEIKGEVEKLEKEAIEAEQWLNSSPEFDKDTRSTYRVKKLEEHSKIFIPFDLTIDKAKKVDSFEFVERYQRYFMQTFEPEDGTRKYGKNLDTKQAVPPMIKLVSLGHNFNRFMMTESNDKHVTRA